jgi:hypothetical protein
LVIRPSRQRRPVRFSACAGSTWRRVRDPDDRRYLRPRCRGRATRERPRSGWRWEKVYRQAWPTRAAARAATFSYTESWYDPRRRQTTLAYLSPAEFDANTPSSLSRSRHRFQPTDRSRAPRPGPHTGSQRAASPRSGSIRSPTARCLPRTPTLDPPAPLRPRQTPHKDQPHSLVSPLYGDKTSPLVYNINHKSQTLVRTGGGPDIAGVARRAAGPAVVLV